MAIVAAEGAGAFTDLFPILIIVAVFYFIVMRPTSKQEKERRKRVETLKKGDKVVIGGGIFAKVVNADEPHVATVEIGDRLRIQVLKRDIVDSQEGAIKAQERLRPPAKKPKNEAASEADDKSSDKSKVESASKA